MTATLPLRFTHLTPGEITLARAFIQKNPINATGWRFDEHLGDGMPLDPTWPPYVQHMAKTLTQRRVDMIGETPTGDWIIELKERGNIHAIGQLLVYAALYREKYPTRPAPRLALVSLYLGYDLQTTLNSFDITHFLL